MRESVVETASVKKAKAAGWARRKYQQIGRRGSPDDWFLKGGIAFIVEFKRPGKEPTLQQAREHGRLAAAGFPVHAVDTIEKFDALLAQMEIRVLLG